MSTIYELVFNALNANKVYQLVLTSHAQALAAEIYEIDVLLVSLFCFDQVLFYIHTSTPLTDAANTLDNRDESHQNPATHVIGRKRPAAVAQSSMLLKPESPFYYRASRGVQYRNYTTQRHIRGKELDALVGAVHREKQRIGNLSCSDSYTIQESHNGRLDWTVIAEHVSAACGNARTADECRIKWGVFLNNDASPLEHNTPRLGPKWSLESDRKLREAVERYGIGNWLIVARAVSEDAMASQCEGRFFRVADLSTKRGAWTQEEDTRLRAAMAAHGHSWIDVALAIRGRTNNQCRERWLYLQRIATAATNKGKTAEQLQGNSNDKTGCRRRQP